MKETPFFFLNGSYNLFGILHEPEKQPNGEGFVFCHPFAEEKLWSHRVFVNFARDLAHLGYTVLRFDYMGHGDSDGKFEESSIETRLSDIKCAINILRENDKLPSGVNLLGLRLGASLAALIAEKKVDINRLVLWDPIINGAAYMKQMMRINLSTQSAVYKEIRFNTDALVKMMKNGETVNIDGYEISWPFFEQCRKINLINSNKDFTGKNLLIQISKKEGKFKEDFVTLSKLYSNNTLTLSIEEPFWTEIRYYYYRAENLFKITKDWLSSK